MGDDVVPFYHGFRLHKACAEQHRWPAYFPRRAGHNDIVECDPRGYFGEVAQFLLAVRQRAAGLDVSMPSVLPDAAPKQLEMVPWAQAAGKSGQRADKLTDEPVAAVVPGGAQDAPRMLAGPEDGRYEMLRQGCVTRA